MDGEYTAYQQFVPAPEIAARVHAGVGGSAGARVHPHPDLVLRLRTSSPHMARNTGGADRRWPSGKPHTGTAMRG